LISASSKTQFFEALTHSLAPVFYVIHLRDKIEIFRDA
jgi:hypothetical protein